MEEPPDEMEQDKVGYLLNEIVRNRQKLQELSSEMLPLQTLLITMDGAFLSQHGIVS